MLGAHHGCRVRQIADRAPHQMGLDGFATLCYTTSTLYFVKVSFVQK
jgi:hypothetical protein